MLILIKLDNGIQERTFRISVVNKTLVMDKEATDLTLYIRGFIQKTIINIITRYGLSWEDKEDYTNEAYLKLYEILPKVKPNKNFKSYLGTAIDNHLKDILKSARKRDRFGLQHTYDSDYLANLELIDSGDGILSDGSIIIKEDK